MARVTPTQGGAHEISVPLLTLRRHRLNEMGLWGRQGKKSREELVQLAADAATKGGTAQGAFAMKEPLGRLRAWRNGVVRLFFPGRLS